mgnify:CR=1 FL=1
MISDSTYPAGLLHPRVYGTYPRLLETYVARKGVLTLPRAVHKITRQAADRFGLTKKGRIQPGADADLCLFSLGKYPREGHLGAAGAAGGGHGLRVRERRARRGGGPLHRRAQREKPCKL